MFRLALSPGARLGKPCCCRDNAAAELLGSTETAAPPKRDPACYYELGPGTLGYDPKWGDSCNVVLRKVES